MDVVRTMVLAGLATDGDDSISGWGNNNTADTLFGGLGNDTLSGLDGADTYVFNVGDGQDVIDDNGNYDTDKLIIDGYVQSDVTFSRAGDDLIISFSGSSDQITIINTLDLDSKDQIERIEFTDGTVLLIDAVRMEVLASLATDGDDSITGWGSSNTPDTLLGGLGNDTLHGLDGSDTYIFNAGDGQDVIEDNGNYDTDQLIIHGYNPENVTASYLSGTHDGLVLTFTGSSDRITIINTLDNDNQDRIEQIIFDDGTVWNIQDVVAYGILSTEDNETLEGSSSADVFVFGDNWGQDQINAFVDGDDLIDLSQSGVSFSDLTISQVGSDAKIEDMNGNSILVIDVQVSNLSQDDFIF